MKRTNSNSRIAVVLISASLILTAAITVCGKGNYLGKTDRPLRYRPDGTDFVVLNGKEFFNRPLYGTNSAFRIDGGDLPEFSLYLPGRGGNLRLGIKTAAGTKWLFKAARIEARYRPGELIYTINDPILFGATLRISVLPIVETTGVILRAEVNRAVTQTELVFAFGGINGERGRRDGDIGTEREPVSRFFQFKPSYAADNKIETSDGHFIVTSPAATFFGTSAPHAKTWASSAANWDSPERVISNSAPGSGPLIAAGSLQLSFGAPAYLSLQRLDPNQAISSGSRAKLQSSQVDSEAVAESGPFGRFAAPFEATLLPGLFSLAERHRSDISSQVTVDTPDPYINAAVAALNVAANAIWDDRLGAYMHGAVAWRVPLAGWRGPYAGDALGRHDRADRHVYYWAEKQNTTPIKSSPPIQDASVHFARNEPELHSNGDIANSHYDMNLVYIDELFRHLEWTGNLTEARRLWPVIERHLAWERRLFRREFGPVGLPLYEAFAAIWASDDLQYEGGGVTHASAYNYYHNRSAARIARLIGQDPSPYDREAELILRAMRTQLWLTDRGWFGEWKDLTGGQLVHPNIGLWTFYHTLDSQVTTPFESWQMSRFVDTEIPKIPINGEGVPPEGLFTLPTTTWMPYTWSTNNVVMAEAAHTALAYWQAGRHDLAYRLFKGEILDSMYLGLCPGNVGMTTAFDMARGESQRDFADGIGTNARALVEGLFGIHYDSLDKEVTITPGWPAGWNRAKITHPDITLQFDRNTRFDHYDVQLSPIEQKRLRMRLSAPRDNIAKLTVNGRDVSWKAFEDSVGGPTIELDCGTDSHFDIRISWSGESVVSQGPLGESIAAVGERFQFNAGSAENVDSFDPQSVLKISTSSKSTLAGTISGSLGHRTIFVKLRQGKMIWWRPVSIDVRPKYELIPSAIQDKSHLRFRLRNNSSQSLTGAFKISVNDGAAISQVAPALSSGGTESREIVLPVTGLLPGTNRVSVANRAGTIVQGSVINWNIPANSPANVVDHIDLAGFFNDRITEVFKHEYKAPRSPYVSLAIPWQGIGSWVHWDAKFEIDDSGIRRKAAANGGFIGLSGNISFQTPDSSNEKNVIFTSQWTNFPDHIAVPLKGSARHIYLMAAGSTNSMQSRFENGKITVSYTDGSSENLSLKNPETWWPIDQDYFIDDYAFKDDVALPPRINLKSGSVRFLDAHSFKGKGGVIIGGAATVLDIPINPAKTLKSLTVQTIANEVVVGLMSATLVRN